MVPVSTGVDGRRVTRRRSCPSCGERPDRLRVYRWNGRAYCGSSCQDTVLDGYRKTQHDISQSRRRRPMNLDRIRDLLYHEFRARPKLTLLT
jgi:endogenous inhibitor of DNA gyrase (YacG/DUF329 family)